MRLDITLDLAFDITQDIALDMPLYNIHDNGYFIEYEIGHDI